LQEAKAPARTAANRARNIRWPMRGENAAVRPAVRPRQRRCWIVRRWTWVSRRRWQPTAAYRYATYMPFWN